MKESSTRAFPNGLIPSPLARHVKIFTHWISGGGVVVGGDVVGRFMLMLMLEVAVVVLVVRA